MPFGRVVTKWWMSPVGLSHGYPSYIRSHLANTGAGNGFLGGLAAGLALAGPDLYQGRTTVSQPCTNLDSQAMLYGAVSASFMIEQRGLPVLAVDRETGVETWNNDIPQRRLDTLRERHNTG